MLRKEKTPVEAKDWKRKKLSQESHARCASSIHPEATSRRNRGDALRYMKILFQNLVEFSPLASSVSTVPTVLIMALSVAVLVIAFIQSGESSDDDDSGPGDGGIMQPVGLSA